MSQAGRMFGSVISAFGIDATDAAGELLAAAALAVNNPGHPPLKQPLPLFADGTHPSNQTRPEPAANTTSTHNRHHKHPEHRHNRL